MSNRQRRDRSKYNRKFVRTPGYVEMLADRIRVLREQRNMSSYDLSVRAGMSTAYIWALESGRITDPSLNRIVAIANALKINVCDLLSGVDKHRKRRYPDFVHEKKDVQDLLVTLLKTDPKIIGSLKKKMRDNQKNNMAIYER